MKRSGDVTAAAIVMFSGVGIISVFGLLVFISLRGQEPPEPAWAVFLLTLTYGIPVVWGALNGYGILKLRTWARISTIIMSVMATCFCGFVMLGAILTPIITRGASDFSPGDARLVAVVMLATSAIPLAIAIWWLVLFTRKRVVLEFATRGAGAASFAPDAHPQSAAFIPPPARAGFASTHPASITVIAIFLLAIAAFFPLMFLYPTNWRITVIFGILMTGRKMMLAATVWAILGLTLGLGLLWLKNWARIGTIVYCVVGLVNTIMSVGKTGTLMDALHKAMGIPAPPLPPALQRAIAIGEVIFGVALNFAAIYFLLARRAAFYALPPSPDAPVVASDAQTGG